MTKDALINKILQTLLKLPQNKLKEVDDFSDFVLKKHDEEVLNEGIKQLVCDSKSFDFLNDEEELYSEEDLKVKFN